MPDASNNWTGLDVEYCRAMAAAVFNDARSCPLHSADLAGTLHRARHGEVDVLSRTTTWTMSRDTQLGISFVGITYL